MRPISRRAALGLVALPAVLGAAAAPSSALEAAGQGGDDTDAVQRALDALSSHDKVLTFPKGRVFSVETLTLPAIDGLTLVGNGSTLRKRPGGAPWIAASASWVEGRSYAQPPSRIGDLAFDGAGIAETCLIHQGWDSDIEGCVFSGARLDGLVVAADRRDGAPISTTLVNNRMRSCRMRGNGRDGLRILDSRRNAATDLFVKDCFVYDNGRWGVAADTLGGTQIVGLHLYHNGRGDLSVGFHAQGGTIDRVYCESPLSVEFNDGISAGMLVNSAIKGEVRCNFRGRSETVVSRGNLYFDDGHILHAGGRASHVVHSIADVFASSAPFRWPRPDALGAIIASDSYVLGEATALSGPQSASSPSRRRGWGNAPPKAGPFARGSVVWSLAPASGAPLGWVCVDTGEPGAWRALPRVET